MAIDTLLNKLDRVKPTGKGTWRAVCPAHEGNNPSSLSIRETDDGTVLIKCHAHNCSAHDIVSSVGLELDDLFPEKPLGHHKKPLSRPFPIADCFRAVAFEVLLVAMAASRMGTGQLFDDADRARLMLAASRIREALHAAGVKP